MNGDIRKFVLVGAAATALLLAACIPAPPPPPAKSEGAPAGGAAASGAAAKVAGDLNSGKALFASKGCVACHVAAGVPGAVGTIGPNLNGLGDVAKRPTLASGEANTPANLRGWIKDPQAKKPGTAMPNLNLTDKEADDLVALMQSLK